MIEAIHQSMLNMAFRCGEQFRRRYIENEIIPPGIAAGRGTGLHYANKVNLKQKIQTGEDLPLGDIKDATRDGYINAFQNGVYIPKDKLSEKDKLINEGLEDSIRCAEVYREKVSPEINPKAVEEPFQIDVGLELPFAGTIDIEQTAKIDDLKTAAKTWPKGQIEKEIQPVLYSLVHEKITTIKPLFKYHIMIARRGKEGNVTSAGYDSQEITCTEKHYNSLMHCASLFIGMLKKGVFVPANPSSWWCDKSWCGYFYTCPFRGNGTQKKWI
ncbi:MAG: hypothetical protein ACE14T_11930 [Syntrophales bacterium]